MEVSFSMSLLANGNARSLRNCNLQGPIPDFTAFQETSLSLANFVYPFFIHDGQDGTPIWAMLGCLGLGGDVDLWKWSIKQIRFRKKTPHLLPAMLMGRSIGNQSLQIRSVLGLELMKEGCLRKQLWRKKNSCTTEGDHINQESRDKVKKQTSECDICLLGSYKCFVCGLNLNNYFVYHRHIGKFVMFDGVFTHD
ncbi:uncharacterized protein LOC126600667 isoform X2 [Malus sylvestris]|nr:uncharacterized protein LOC126600667 isoform X2 [Malus sylvestris]